MDSKEEQSSKEHYWAHVDYETKRIQFAEEHFGNVADFSTKICPIPELKNLVYLIGLLHDAGKLGCENQKDFENILKEGDHVHKHNLDHSTAGGRIARELLKEKTVSEFLSTVIYFHHGISDCIDLQSGYSMQERRAENQIEYNLISERFFQIFDRKMIAEKCEKVLADYRFIDKKIGSFVAQNKVKNRSCGNGYFFIGMYLRLLLSILIDSDWSDTARFFQGSPLPERTSAEKIHQIWKQSVEYFERYLYEQVQKNPENGNLLNNYRQEISELCKLAAETNQSLYRLTVPTGAGKTLSSLHFALHHACEMEKQHIIYIAPFNSILEQNAEEIRKAVGNPDIVLEHHCNVICKEEEEDKYRSLTETWDSPIIVTTAVQILNVLFSDQKSFIRRMHTLCNSVIIFDEVQAFPVKCMELFNLAVNFLSFFGKTTVVLCSATQPTLKDLRENNIFQCVEMTGESGKYEKAFKRADIVDATDLCPGGMKIEDLRDFVLDKTKIFNSVLVIVNTTACALSLFENLKNCCSYEYKIFHLSNNMCPQNKLDTLEEIKSALKDNKNGDSETKIICVSTQVVEAGVNFSFGCVVRSKAGLDNVIQAAGRCNRHKEFSRMGLVYIVQMSKEAERLEKLPEIREAQAALQKVLDNFKSNPEIFKYTLSSEEAIKAYYKNYLDKLKSNETKFPAKSYNTTLVELLGKDELGRKQYERAHCNKMDSRFAQAFQTAGKEFEVISNDYKINVVVPYNYEAKELIAKLNSNYLDLDEGKRMIRRLQRYSLGISEYRKNKLNNALYEICDGEILVLSEGYYDREVGVTDIPKMDFYSM